MDRPTPGPRTARPIMCVSRKSVVSVSRVARHAQQPQPHRARAVVGRGRDTPYSGSPRLQDAAGHETPYTFEDQRHANPGCRGAGLGDPVDFHQAQRLVAALVARQVM